MKDPRSADEHAGWRRVSVGPSLAAAALLVAIVALVALSTGIDDRRAGNSPTTTLAGTAQPPLSPSPWATTAVPSTAPIVPPTIAPSQTATSPPAPPDGEEPGDGLVIDWRRQADASGLGIVGEDGSGLSGSAVVFNGRYVIAGAAYDLAAEEDAPAIWTSPDGTNWQRSELEGDSGYSVIEGLAVTESGLVAVGREAFAGPFTVWLSSDGDQWQRIDGQGPPRAHKIHLAASRSELIAFVYVLDEEGQLLASTWTSTDGRSWLPATDAASEAVAGGLQAIAGEGDNLVALVADSAEPRAPRRVIEAWQHTASDGWQRAGELPESAGAQVFGAVAGPRGWVALGAHFAGDQPDQYLAWASSDGTTWHMAETAPAFGGLIELRDVIGSNAGFVAVGYEWTEYGCALDPSAIRGVTWTSADGLTWRRMSRRGWQGSRIDVLLRNGRTLIGVGPAWGRRGADGAVWTARLPAVADDSGAGTEQPLPPPTDPGCG